MYNQNYKVEIPQFPDREVSIAEYGAKSGDFSRQRKKEGPAAFSFKNISSKTMCIRKARRVRALAEPDQSSYHFPPRRNGFCLVRFVQKYSDRLHGTPCR